MNRTKWLFVVVAAFMSVIGGDSRANGQQPVIVLPVDQTTSYKGEEYLLIGNANRGAGEPVIAIDPKDPNTIIVGAMANNHYVEGEKLPAPGHFPGQDTISVYRNTPDSSISTYAISHDRGRTWTFMNDPFREYRKMNGTADTFVGIGRDETLFIGSMHFFPRDASPEMIRVEKGPGPGLLFGATDIAWSKDGGKTWSTPQHVMGQYDKLEDYGPGVKPSFVVTTPYDRPFLITDHSTGTLYVPGNGTGGEPPHAETFIRASDDNGKTWGKIYAYDGPDYPEGGGMAARPAAVDGVLGVTYVASSAPSNTGGKCPCVVFGVSRDEGKTFERHVVQYDFPPLTVETFTGMGSPSLAADPSHPGRFAVMTTTAARSEMYVYLTDDYGKTWKAPVRAGSTPGAIIVRPDIAYSPRGELATMWLAVNPDQTYSAWSSVSHDGGSTFSAPLQVSHGASPGRLAIKNRGNNWDGDDLSSIAVDNDFVHIVWADGRAGFLGAWYARVPLTSY